MQRCRQMGYKIENEHSHVSGRHGHVMSVLRPACLSDPLGRSTDFTSKPSRRLSQLRLEKDFVFESFKLSWQTAKGHTPRNYWDGLRSWFQEMSLPVLLLSTFKSFLFYMFVLRFELRHVDLLRIFEAVLTRMAWHRFKNSRVQAESVSKGDLEEASGNFFRYVVEIHHNPPCWKRLSDN